MAILNLLGAPHTYDLSRVSGDRPTLVFIHGWLLSRAYWTPILTALGAEYSCLTYDLRGFGDSASHLHYPPLDIFSPEFAIPAIARPDLHRQLDRTFPQAARTAHSLAAYAHDLGQLIQSLGCDRVWLIGHSLGGSIALWGAHLWPEQVAGVITINAGGGIYIKEAFEQFRKFGKNLVKNRVPWLRYCPGMDWAFGWLMVHHRLHRHWGKRRLHDFLIADEIAALGALLETTTETEVHLLPQLTSQLPQPVYFLAGQEDRVMELKYVRHLASFHPLFHEEASNLREIPQCGHLAMVEQPQAVIDNLRAILQHHSC